MAYIYSRKLNTELCNYIKIEDITIKDKIKENLIYFSSKLHPVSPAGVLYGLLFRCLRQKSYGYTLPMSLVVVLILPMSPAGEVSITLVKS